MKSRIIGIIPARYKSSRLPGKPLVDIEGKPMIQRVYESAKKSKLLHKVVIATDDQRIYDTAKRFGAEVFMTPEELPSGSDRIAYVAEQIPEAGIVVNIQGDEPFIPSHMIDSSLQPLLFDKNSNVSSLMKRITTIDELISHNTVKVVCDNENFALYFSRHPIPFDRDELPLDKKITTIPYYKHIGLYAYRREYLFRFTQLEPGRLEGVEKLEQLRMLENNVRIRMVETNLESLSVDTPEDLEVVRNYYRKNLW